MITWAKIIAGVISLFNAIAAWAVREQAKADGAAIQRDADTEADNARLTEAERAVDALRTNGGVPVEVDPFNRDNS